MSMNNIFYSVEQGSLFNNVISVDTAIFFIIPVFTVSDFSLTLVVASLGRLSQCSSKQSCMFSLMKIEDQFLII